MTLKTVLFDLDGTLLDTAPDLAQALNHTLVSEGKNPLAFKLVRHVVSDGANAMLEVGFQIDRNSPDLLPYRKKMLAFYLADLSSKTTPFKGITPLIEKLANNSIQWGIVTNKPWNYTQPLMESFEFSCPPVCILCPDHVTNKKPHPEPLLLACEYAKCLPSECIYIGDHERDILCGINAGMETIAAAYGYIEKSDSVHNWNANYIANTGDEIWTIIKDKI